MNQYYSYFVCTYYVTQNNWLGHTFDQFSSSCNNKPWLIHCLAEGRYQQMAETV